MAGARIDWPAAKALYVALGPKRSYRKVAAEFAVSEAAVRKHARPERWRKAAEEADARDAGRLVKRAFSDRAAYHDAVMEIAELAYGKATEQLRNGKGEVKLSDLPAIDRMVRLELGEATDRITVDEMRSGFQTLLVVAIGYVPKARQPEFLEAANAALGVSVDQDEAA